MNAFDLKNSSLFKDGDGDEIYKFIRNNCSEPCRTDTLNYVENLWNVYKPFCPDLHFAKDFPKNFRARWWEMYLANALLNGGCNLSKPPPKGPDIKLDLNGSTWVEAVSVGKGKDEDKIKSASVGSIDPNKTILRITSVFEKKAEKFKEYIEDGVIQPSDKQIIAIDISSIDNSDIIDHDGGHNMIPLICKALLGVGELTYSMPIDLDSDKIGQMSSHYPVRDKITKKNGTDIPTTNFLYNDYKHISAVITNTEKYVKYPLYGRKFKVLLNPYAINKLSSNEFLFCHSISYEKNGILNIKKN